MGIKTVKLNPKAEMPLAIVGVVLGVIELLMAVLINFAYVYGLVGLFFFLPAMVVGLLVVMQEENKHSVILGVIGLGFCRMAIVLGSAWIPIQFVKIVKEFILSVL